MADIKMVATFLLDVLGGETSNDMAQREVELLIKPWFEKLSTSVPPLPGESVAATILRPKTAALLFDRVTGRIIASDMPSDVAVYGATDAEIWSQVGAIGELEGKFWNPQQALESFQRVGVPRWRGAPSVERTLAEAIAIERGWSVTPFFGSEEERDSQYLPGNRAVVSAAIASLQVVDEASLTWGQVLEFRKDREAKTAYRRMLHWLDSTMLGKSTEFIADEMAQRLEDYEWSLQKHGIQTLTGTVSSLIDPHFLSATSLAVGAVAVAGGGGAWAAATGGLLTIGRAAISVTTQLVDYIDKKRGAARDIAFVHYLKALK